jgi:biopolymer transport protein ExbD
MTPLIDVLLVLLVMFIMTIPVMTHAVRIDNPLAATRTSRVPPAVRITVDRFARYDFVAKALADLQYRGLRSIGFVNNE